MQNKTRYNTDRQVTAYPNALAGGIRRAVAEHDDRGEAVVAVLERVPREHFAISSEGREGLGLDLRVGKDVGVDFVFVGFEGDAGEGLVAGACSRDVGGLLLENEENGEQKNGLHFCLCVGCALFRLS
jgi:hypothetical protein